MKLSIRSLIIIFALHSTLSLAATYTLRVGHDMKEESPMHKALLEFANLVSFRSNADVSVKIYPNMMLGNDVEMTKMIQAGTLDIGVIPTAKLSVLAPQMSVLDLPYLFTNSEQAHRHVDGLLGRILLDSLSEHGIKGLSIWESGFKQITSNFAINDISDFENQPFRIMQSDFLSEQYELVKANPIVTDFKHITAALANGDATAQENPLASIIDKDIYRQQKFLYLSNHAYLAQAFIMNQTLFENLPPKIQNIIHYSAITLANRQRALLQSSKEVHLATLATNPISIETLPASVTSQLKSAWQPLYEELYEANKSSPQLVETIQSISNERSQNAIKIGLSTDLSLGGAQAGLSIQRGAILAIDQINHSGGVLGKNLELTVNDHQGSISRGKDDITTLIDDKKVDVILGGLHSPVVLAQIKYLSNKNTCFLIPWAAATPIVDNGLANNFVFRISIRDQYAGKLLLEQAHAYGHRIALVLENTPWGKSNFKAIQAAAKQHSDMILITKWINWGKKDFMTELEEFNSSDVDAIILVSNENEAVNLAINNNSLAKPIPIVSHWGMTGGFFWERTPTLDYDFLFLQTVPAIDRESTQSFIKAYDEYYGQSTYPAMPGTYHAYDLIHLYAKAVAAGQSTQCDGVTQQLKLIQQHEGALKSYIAPFANSHEALVPDDINFYHFTKGGNIVKNEKILDH